MSGNGEDTRASPSLLLDIKQALDIILSQNASITSEQDEARKSRSLMHDKQDNLSAEVREVSATVKRIEPQVVDHERWRQQITGGGIVLASLGGLVMVAMGFVLKDLWGWIAGHLHWK